MSADCDLLFGVLAVQMDFITREQLVAAMTAWVLDKGKSLGQVLVERGALREDARCLVDAAVQKHLQMHEGDPHRSLASVQVFGTVGGDLQRIVDPDLGASLTLVPGQHGLATPQAEQPPSPTADTRTDLPARASKPSAGPPTSSGTRYRVIRPHARGGLGEVFAAHDEQLDREVALKEIQLRFADDPDSRARFLLEGKITGNLEHPGIVPVYGLGTYADGRPYYAMRFIKGDSLLDAIRRFHAPEPAGRDAVRPTLELRQLLGRFLAVCNAVAYAHARGVIHRDIKPANVMLGEFGETLVVDWGLAKVVGRADGTGGTLEAGLCPASASDSAATRMGSAMGTPQYMSPEQAAGRLDLLGPASDVYGLGATLYHVLVGKPPFEGSDVGEMLRQVQAGEFLPPRRVRSGVPAALEAVCLKAMARNPEDRYDSAQALAGDVEHWLADEPVSAWREPWNVKARRWAKRHRMLVTASVAALLVASISLGVAATFLTRVNDQLAQANDRLLEAKEAEERAKEEALEQRDLALRRLKEGEEEHERAFFYLRSLVNLERFGRSLTRQPLRQDFGLRVRLLNAGNPGKAMFRGTIARGDFDSSRPFLLSVEATCDCHLHVFYAIPGDARAVRGQRGDRLPPILCLFPNKEEKNSSIKGSASHTLLNRPGLFLSPVHTTGEMAFLYVLATERDWECRPDGHHAGFYSFSKSAARKLAKQIADTFAEADGPLARQRISEELFVFNVRDGGK